MGIIAKGNTAGRRPLILNPEASEQSVTVTFTVSFPEQSPQPVHVKGPFSSQSGTGCRTLIKTIAVAHIPTYLVPTHGLLSFGYLNLPRFLHHP